MVYPNLYEREVTSMTVRLRVPQPKLPSVPGCRSVLRELAVQVLCCHLELCRALQVDVCDDVLIGVNVVHRVVGERVLRPARHPDDDCVRGRWGDYWQGERDAGLGCCVALDSTTRPWTAYMAQKGFALAT